MTSLIIYLNKYMEEEEIEICNICEQPIERSPVTGRLECGCEN